MLANKCEPLEPREGEWSEDECELQALLRTTEYENDKDRNCDRVAGTCEWFLNQPNFKLWQDNSLSSILLVTASPGCGKSVLAKSLIEHELKPSNTDKQAICYFFFKDDDERRRSAHNALHALLHQLFAQRKSLI